MNTSVDSYTVTANELQSFVERIEAIEMEIGDWQVQKKDVYTEAKGQGYDTAVIKTLISLRKRKPDEIAEQEAILDMYKSALGMA